MTEQLDFLWTYPLVRVLVALLLCFAVTTLALFAKLHELRADLAYLAALIGRARPANDDEVVP